MIGSILGTVLKYTELTLNEDDVSIFLKKNDEIFHKLRKLNIKMLKVPYDYSH